MQALETSVVLNAVGIAQSVLGTSVAVTPTAGESGSGNGVAGPRETGVGMAVGAAAVAIGAAAVLL